MPLHRDHNWDIFGILLEDQEVRDPLIDTLQQSNSYLHDACAVCHII